MIQIDMEMPRNCCECPLQDVSNSFACSAIETFMNTASFSCTRPEWCPLHDGNEEKSGLDLVKGIFADFIKKYGYLPQKMVVTENVLQKLRDEASLKFQLSSYIAPKYCGVDIETVDDNSAILTTLSGDGIKYLLKEGSVSNESVPENS